MVIPKVRLSRILQRKPAIEAFLREIFGITFLIFTRSALSNLQLKENNSG
ncbi:hypothetical protein CLOSCI_00947 [[Clostridium] scindens ATCC 35704]|nr:hypothetical protein CLOSCI_00947 [[Clostridium] scindens ATCC 35704]